jgi:DNA-binding NtrC family response regulator
LFGHEKGAFTGAAGKRLSPFVEARGGTVFLDELGELPLELQPKLLRVLAEHRIKSVGSNTYVPVDVRIIAATRRDLLLEINRGTFRDDLFFRIAEERVDLPSLRDRSEDIIPLVRHMMASFGKESAFERVPSESFDRLVKYDWPGNVRELRNLVKRALAYDRAGPLDLAQHLSPARDSATRNPSATPDDVTRSETYERSRQSHDRAYFLTLYAATKGNLSEMARVAGLDRTTVRTALRKLGIAARTGRQD